MPAFFRRPDLRDCRPGLVLAFTLVIFILAGLMGMSILLQARNYHGASNKTHQGSLAFLSADAAARITARIVLNILNPGLWGPLDDLLLADNHPLDGPTYPLKVELDRQGLEDFVDNIKSGVSNYDYAKRYKQAGLLDVDDEPHVFFNIKLKNDKGDYYDLTVATAAISLERHEGIGGGTFQEGGSLDGGDAYGKGLPTNTIINLAVTANARAISHSNLPGDDAVSFGQSNEARSIVTIHYQVAL